MRITDSARKGDYSDLITPDGRLFWTSPDMYDPVHEKPLYSTAQVAKFFFACSTPWLYWHLITEPKLVHPEIGGLQLMRTDTSVPARRWRLYDVEMFAHILAAHGVLEGISLARTIRIVKLSAELWGYEL